MKITISERLPTTHHTPVSVGSVAALLGAALMLVAVAAHAQSTGLRLMPVGDSITAGQGSSNGDGYRGPLYSALKDHGVALDFVGSRRDGVMLDPDHEGYSGYRIEQVAALINAELTVYHPNLVTLHLGTNDMGQGYQVSSAPARLASLIDQIIAADPQVTILVAQLVCNATASTQSSIDSFNSKIPGIVQTRAKAGKHVYLVSMNSLTESDLADGLHPNDSGYQKMAAAWDAGIQHAIAEGRIDQIEFAGAFEIRNQASQLAVDVSGGSTDNGATVIQWEFGGKSNQLWNFIPTSDGFYQIKNVFSGLDLNVAGASKESGAKVVQWQYGSDGNDQWLPTKQDDGSYTFTNRNSNLFLNNPGESTQGTQLDQQEARAGANQKFILTAR